jgi:multiple sugar transport system substrate-binding protein
MNVNKLIAFYSIILVISLILSIGYSSIKPVSAQKKQVTLTAIVAEPKDRWDILFKDAQQKLNEKHPDMDIKVDYTVLPYDATRTQILTAMAGRTPLDLVSVDQTWLGQFAQGGFLSDLSDRAKSWGKEKDWYQTNWDGGKYNGKLYGIWAWTDIRAMWYWKDLLSRAAINPLSLKTWNGYIADAKQLNNVLRDQRIQGMHLVGASQSPDMWYPYLWMLGGDILKQKNGHPTRGTYWFPAFNSTAGIKALEFLKQQVDAGIRPQINHFWGQEFADRKFAVMLEGSWLLGAFPHEQWTSLNQKIGMLPMFPVPNIGYKTATMMGGWILGIPETSQNKDLAWELLTTMLDPQVLTPMLQKEGYLPTQKPIGEGPYAANLNSSIPYYKEMISMISIGHSRPNIPEYPQIADNIRQSIDEVYYGMKDPKQALDEAAAKSAKVLGW